MLAPGFLPSYIKICAMHTLHLGVIQLLNGSIFTLVDELGNLSYLALIHRGSLFSMNPRTKPASKPRS